MNSAELVITAINGATHRIASRDSIAWLATLPSGNVLAVLGLGRIEMSAGEWMRVLSWPWVRITTEVPPVTLQESTPVAPTPPVVSRPQEAPPAPPRRPVAVKAKSPAAPRRATKKSR